MTAEAQARVQAHLATVEPDDTLSDEQRASYRDRIKALLRQRDAVLVAHYYTDPEIQSLAEETGGCVSDSLEMARFGKDHPASTLIVAGVKFMGETAKILSPEKRVFMPTLEATTSAMATTDAGDSGRTRMPASGYAAPKSCKPLASNSSCTMPAPSQPNTSAPDFSRT